MEKIQIIKSRWAEDNRYAMIELAPFELFDKAQEDVAYILQIIEDLNRLNQMNQRNEYKGFPWLEERPAMWSGWPKDRPLPTLEQYKKAEEKYREEIRVNDKRLAIDGKSDLSDWRMGLSFVMSTYSRFVWIGYFD